MAMQLLPGIIDFKQIGCIVFRIVFETSLKGAYLNLTSFLFRGSNKKGFSNKLISCMNDVMV